MIVIKWISVDSNRMEAVAHDGETMYIQFHDGSVYAYENVSVQEFRNFMSSSSLGRELVYFQQQHPYHRV